MNGEFDRLVPFVRGAITVLGLGRGSLKSATKARHSSVEEDRFDLARPSHRPDNILLSPSSGKYGFFATYPRGSNSSFRTGRRSPSNRASLTSQDPTSHRFLHATYERGVEAYLEALEEAEGL
jgi:hypothetical protein